MAPGTGIILLWVTLAALFVGVKLGETITLA